MTDKGSKWMVRVGWVLSVLPAGLLLYSGVGKLVGGESLEQVFEQLGWPVNLALALAIVEIGCTVVYLVPRTAVLGAILLTGYMGGAMATHVRIGEDFYMQFLVGVVLWLGIFLRDARLRALVPWRR